MDILKVQWERKQAKKHKKTFEKSLYVHFKTGLLDPNQLKKKIYKKRR